MKIISKLLVYGWGGTGLNPQRKEEFIAMQKSFFTSSIQDFQTIYQVRLAILSNPNNAASLKQQAQLKFSPLICLNKHTLAYGKMYQALMFQNHMTFHGIGQTKELVQLYWTFIQEAGRNIRNLDLGTLFLALKAPQLHESFKDITNDILLSSSRRSCIPIPPLIHNAVPSLHQVLLPTVPI